MQADIESVPSWRRFVSEEETNQQIGELVREQDAAEKGVANLEHKLAQLAERFQELAASLRKHLASTPTDLNISKDEALDKSLRFGEESGVTVGGLVEMLRERAKYAIRIEECKRQINRLK
jgi:K+/H+ antiporter YhaU regulatory subunit KhtT